MTLRTLSEQIGLKHSCLCVGLDTASASFTFNKEVIDATAPYAVAYKPNVAFYEAGGSEGWKCLEKTVSYIRSHYPEHFVIADAKRGDIGNTAVQYARAFFEHMDCHAVTMAPYMGYDSIAPFLEYEGKWIILLVLTSNPSASDFETLTLSDGRPLYRKVIETANTWAGPQKIMYVAGATRSLVLEEIRQAAPDHFLLVPGVGAQGGSVEEVFRYGKNSQGGLLINVSRGIVQSPLGPETAARNYAQEFAKYL